MSEDAVVESSQALSFAVRLAQDAGRLLLDYFEKAGLASSYKPDRTLVTEADFAVDRFISKAIAEDFPQDVNLSEELYPQISQAASSAKAVWVIDPLDGTTNFQLHLHIWGVLITRLIGGFPELSVQYFPKVNELYTAQHGRGAYLNGELLQIPSSSNQEKISFFSCCSRTFRNYKVNIPYKARILGSAAYSLCCVARGVAKLAFEATPKIWDLAAGWLLVEEAGGVLTTLDGSEPFPLDDQVDFGNQTFPLLAAASYEILERSRKQIEPR